MPRFWKAASHLGYYLYASLLMPSRLAEYVDLIRSAVAAGYTFLTVEEYARRTRSMQELPPLTFILRKDVDTDPDTIKLMFGVDRRYGVRASYYFRLSTLDFSLMDELASYGCEVSYHFEEIATHAKRCGSNSAQEIVDSLHEIQDRFRENLRWLRTRTGLSMQVVASHGDFANRILQVPNHALLDAELRCELAILAEVYDADLAIGLSARISDVMPPIYWRGGDPLSAVRDRSPVIYLLIHPRQWRTNVRVNLSDAGHRIAEGAGFALRRRMNGYRRRHRLHDTILLDQRSTYRTRAGRHSAKCPEHAAKPWFLTPPN